METNSGCIGIQPIPESGPINASLCIIGILLSNNNISSAHLRGLHEPCLRGSAASSTEVHTFYCRDFRISRSRKLWNYFQGSFPLTWWRRYCYLVEFALSSHSPFERTILFKSIPFRGKTICLGIVREEYPIAWDNLQSSTCLIWNRFVTFYTSPIFQMLRKDITWLGVPYHGFISTDPMELFSV